MDLLLVLDIDGTLNHMGARFDASRVSSVPPMKLAREFLLWFTGAGGKVVYLTGRNKKDMGVATRDWLVKHGFPCHDRIIFYSTTRHGPWTWDAYIRFKKRELDSIIKAHPRHEIVVIDDNSAIVKLGIEAGLPAIQIHGELDWLALFPRLATRHAVPGE